MPEVINKLKTLMAHNKVESVLEVLNSSTSAFPDLQNQVLVLSAKYRDIQKKEILGVLSESDLSKMQAQLNFALVEIISQLENGNVQAGTTAASPAYLASQKKQVFISYNHNDQQIANLLKDKLKEQNIDVIIDSEKMQAGDDIKEFIEKCVRDAQTTISLVSKKSLLSAWVAMESINTFYLEKTNSGKKFIACYIEDDFFHRNFTDEALDYVEAEIKEIQALIIVRMEKNRSIRDLQNELTRLKELCNNMDEIIRRLRESLCIDIRNDNLEANFQKILDSINSR